jgi:hypothetical protein
MEAARAVSIPQDREIVTSFPRNSFSTTKGGSPNPSG